MQRHALGLPGNYCNDRSMALIGEGAIIAAGAVVAHGTKVPAHEIWAGIPAKKVKDCAPRQAEEFTQHYAGYIKDWYLEE